MAHNHQAPFLVILILENQAETQGKNRLPLPNIPWTPQNLYIFGKPYKILLGELSWVVSEPPNPNIFGMPLTLNRLTLMNSLILQTPFPHLSPSLPLLSIRPPLSPAP